MILLHCPLQEWEPLCELPLDPNNAAMEEADPDRGLDVVLTWRGDGKFVASSHRLPAKPG